MLLDWEDALDPTLLIPSFEQHRGAFVVHIGPIARNVVLAAIEVTHEGEHQRVGAEICDAFALLHECLPPTWVGSCGSAAIESKPTLSVKADLSTVKTVNPIGSKPSLIKGRMLVPDLTRRDNDTNGRVALDERVNLIAHKRTPTDITEFIETIEHHQYAATKHKVLELVDLDV